MTHKTLQRLLQLVISLAIIAFALLAARMLKQLSAPPSIKTDETSITYALVERIEPDSHVLRAQGHGTLLPWQSLPIISQVSGKILTTPYELQPGQTLPAGAILYIVDPTEYQFQLNTQQAELARAELALKEATGRHDLAQKEWTLIQSQQNTNALAFDNNEQAELALRLAQLKEKKQLLEAAKSAVKLAQLYLERTKITTPCEGVILEVNATRGQVIAPGNNLMNYACLDKYKVIASFSKNQMRLFDHVNSVDELSVTIEGYRAKVRHQLPQIAAQTQMQQVLIEIDPTQAPHLKLGQYVTVTLSGPPWQKRLYQVPDKGLREGNTLWVASSKNTLEIIPVTLIHSSENQHYVQDPTDNLGPIDLVVSQISSPYKGMPLELGSSSGSTKSELNPATQPSEQSAFDSSASYSNTSQSKASQKQESGQR